VGSLLYGTPAMLVLNLLAFESKKYAAYDRMAKSRPRKDQSERSDLPCHIVIHAYCPICRIKGPLNYSSKTTKMLKKETNPGHEMFI